MKKHIGPGSIVLDVGANIGLYTLEAAKAVGATGRVIAIEASPGHISTIGKSVGLNGFQNVDIISSAVGDVEGMTTLTLPEGANHGMFTLGSVAGSVTMRVNVKRIDDILDEQNVLSVDFIKMDIEGSELVALKGATQTLKGFRPTILIELNEAALRSCGTSSFEVKSLLYSMDYKGSIVGTSGLMPIPSGQIIHECDECLFIPNRADTV
jgi:FkbM family methyltransferase